jgi:hypothetical protein
MALLMSSSASPFWLPAVFGLSAGEGASVVDITSERSYGGMEVAVFTTMFKHLLYCAVLEGLLIDIPKT